MKEITKEEFKKKYSSLTLKEFAKELDVHPRTIANYAKLLGLTKGKGNRTLNRKKLLIK